MKKKILVVFGTRPEAIKMAPVVMELTKTEWFEPIVCVTGQHREMLDSVLEVFEIVPDYDLNIMKAGQDLFDITAKVMLGMRDVIREVHPRMVLVHGDTTTCLAAGLSAFYEKVPLGHVEAGLRTGNVQSPFPEEANRTLVAPIADLHFAPTLQAKNNILLENSDVGETVVVTGNTSIDALYWVRNKLDQYPAQKWISAFGEGLYGRLNIPSRRMVLVTAHRRESFGEGILQLCSALTEAAEEHPEWDFVFPVHPNPNVREPVHAKLANKHNIHLIEPLDYLPFIWAMNRSDICLTDSGGVQEEAPALGKPVLVLRDTTERPEAVIAGGAKLVGMRRKNIVEEINKQMNLVNSGDVNRIQSPYGDGNAASRIVHRMREFVKSEANVNINVASPVPIELSVAIN